MFKTMHEMEIKDNKGFTIAELLITIAIIVILAAIAIQEFNRYRARSIAATLNSDAKNIYKACSAFFADNSSETICTVQDAVSSGYLQSNGVSVTGSINSNSTGNFTLTHSSNAASNAIIDGSGKLTVSEVP